jgi:hypothetical protein
METVRMDVVAQLYKRGYSYRKIREEVMARLDLKSYSLGTVSKDVKRLLKEWRETRIEEMDYAVQLELQRIDDLMCEAWEAWEKSKSETPRVRERLIATPNAEQKDSNSASPTRVERTTEESTSVGDPRYLELIHKLLMERRKILGLYRPEKSDIKVDCRTLFANKPDEELLNEIKELQRKLS